MSSDITATAISMIVNQTASMQPNKTPPKESEVTAASDTDKQTKTDNLTLNNKPETETKQDDGLNNESSNLSTAFTISFEDDTPSNSKKLFGIRDSIRKFAPPKPHTIEKPRPPKSDNQENSYMSFESAPGGCQSKQTFRRDINNSCRSSGRKSDSSRHSNISESAAFLIDKMLNCKQGESLSSICLNSSDKATRDRKLRGKGGTPIKKIAHSSGDILDDEVDFCEDKSDNGTYIVGTDPESDAARRKIDELFGVVKAAEESLMASGKIDTSKKLHATITRSSRQSDKKPPITSERQDHINRFAMGRHSSRSSSSSRQEIVSTSHRPRSTTRQSRNSSCDRTTKLSSSRHKRAASHSSRQSSNKEASDGDTQSSRSSLQHDIEANNIETSSANNPGMKFNRAFALRRARLGLGEPAPSNRISSTPSTNGQEFESPTTSPRRNIGARSSQNTGPQPNLNRSDGGRFSLRMRKHPMPNRLIIGSHESSRAAQQGTATYDSYASRLSGLGKISRPTNFSMSSHQSPVHSASVIPYQSSDELEVISPSRFRRLNSNIPIKREQQSEFDVDGWDYSNEKLSYPFGLEHENLKMVKGNRACSSADRGGSSSQLGALDCLVISAISSLSVKIRSSVCDLMVDHAKRLPSENETRLIVEEILPQLTANSTRPRSPTSIEEIDQSLYFDLAQALKNLKKIEQMVDVMKQISSQITDSPTSHSGHSKSPTNNRVKTNIKMMATAEGSESNPNSETNSLSPV